MSFEIQGIVFSPPSLPLLYLKRFEKRNNGVNGKQKVWVMTGNNATLENSASKTVQ